MHVNYRLMVNHNTSTMIRNRSINNRNKVCCSVPHPSKKWSRPIPLTRGLANYKSRLLDDIKNNEATLYLKADPLGFWHLVY